MLLSNAGPQVGDTRKAVLEHDKDERVVFTVSFFVDHLLGSPNPTRNEQISQTPDKGTEKEIIANRKWEGS